MSWVRLDDGMSEHPKIIGLSNGAFRAHIRGLCYCARHLTDGHVPAPAAKQWGSRAITELVAGGVWRETKAGYEIHDYLDWNPSRDEAEELKRKRAEAGRRGGSRSKPSSKTEANASDMSEAKRNPVPVPVPSFDETHPVSPKLPAIRPRNAQWDGLVDVFGYHPDKDDQPLWGRLANRLDRMGATQDSITEAARRYRIDMPTASLTPTALVKHYQRLMARPVVAAARTGAKADRTLALARQLQEQENQL